MSFNVFVMLEKPTRTMFKKVGKVEARDGLSAMNKARKMCKSSMGIVVSLSKRLKPIWKRKWFGPFVFDFKETPRESGFYDLMESIKRIDV